MKVSEFQSRIVTALYFDGMTHGTFDERALYMKSTAIGLVADDMMREEFAAMCYLEAVKMMQRIEDAPANLNTRDPRFQKHSKTVTVITKKRLTKPG